MQAISKLVSIIGAKAIHMLLYGKGLSRPAPKAERWPTLLAVVCIAGSTTLPARADVIFSTNVNAWNGGVDSDWFNSLNWNFGGIYNAPQSSLITSIAPVTWAGGGLFSSPQREAILNKSFSTADFNILAWDGLSQARIVNGGFLNIYNRNFGQSYVGSSAVINLTGAPQQRATLILDGGHMAGTLKFFPNSRVEIRGSYAAASEGYWYGELGELAITKGSSYASNQTSNPLGILKIDQLTNEGIFNAGFGYQLLGSVNNYGQFNVTGGRSVAFSGVVTNDGVIQVKGVTPSGVDPVSEIKWVGNVTLAGSGTTVISPGNTAGLSGSGSDVLTIGERQTVRGAGYVSGNVVNQGMLVAEGGELRLSGTFDNSGSGVIKPGGGEFVGIEIAPGARLNLAGGTLHGGTIFSSSSSGVLMGGGYQDVALKGNLTVGSDYIRMSKSQLAGSTTITTGAIVTVEDGGIVSVEGRIINNGRLYIRNGNYLTALKLTGDTTLAGGGKTVIAGDGIRGQNVSLTISAGHTLTGAGIIYGENQRLNLTNGGIFEVNGNEQSSSTQMRVDLGGGSFINQGKIDIANRYSLGMFKETLHQTASDAVTHVDGILWLDTLDLSAGMLNGSGTVKGKVIVGSGHIAPGNSPGKLTIDGDLTMGKDSTLELQIAGNVRGISYDWLDVTGKLTLNGSLALDFSGYTPAVGDSFDFISARAGQLSGSFASVSASGYTLSTLADGQVFKVTVTGIIPVPEPNSFLLLTAGLAVMAGLARSHRQRTVVIVARRPVGTDWQRA